MRYPAKLARAQNDLSTHWGQLQALLTSSPSLHTFVFFALDYISMSLHPSIIAPTPSRSHFISTPSAPSASTSSLDSALAKARSHEYPKHAIILVSSIILAATLYNVLSSLFTYLNLQRKRQAQDMPHAAESKVRGSKPQPEESGEESNKGSSHVALRRTPQAVLSAARIMAYRKTRPPLIEVIIIGGYLFAMLLFEFANCKCKNKAYLSSDWHLFFHQLEAYMVY